jgi:hypothetical protein
MMLAPAHRAALSQGKAALLRAVRGDRNCTAVGYGFRRREGALTDEPAVVVSVAKKRPAGYVARDRLLPRTVEIDGRRYAVDVVQAGPFTLGSGTAPVYRRTPGDMAPAAVTDPIPEKIRPARQGCGIANLRIGGVASFGCLVRDLANGNEPAILTSGSALGTLRGARAGDVVVQPVGDPSNPADRLGTLRRYSILTKDGPNRVDAAVVRLDEPEGEGVDTMVARALMPPIQPTHPILGTIVANATDGSTLFTRMDTVLDAMAVDFWGNEPAFVCRDVDFDMNVDKVGTASGYTSSFVVAMGVTPVNLGPPDTEDFYVFDDLVQVDSGFARGGDSGAAVCRGGNGNVRIPLPPVICRLLDAAGRATGLPLPADEPLFDRFRDDFLADSKVGRMLNRVFYVNYQALVDRAEDLQLTPEEADWLGGLYDQYHDFLAGALTNPQTPGPTVTDAHISDVNLTLYGLTTSGRLSDAEATAAWELYTVFERTVGMNRQQLVAMMNDNAVYREVYDILRPVPTLAHLGQFGVDA